MSRTLRAALAALLAAAACGGGTAADRPDLPAADVPPATDVDEAGPDGDAAVDDRLPPDGDDASLADPGADGDPGLPEVADPGAADPGPADPGSGEPAADDGSVDPGTAEAGDDPGPGDPGDGADADDADPPADPGTDDPGPAADAGDADAPEDAAPADVPSPPTALCQPCLADADCDWAGGTGGWSCVLYGPAGRFCGSVCRATLPCPAGYDCRPAALIGGTTANRCVRTGGECACNEEGVARGMRTACSTTNDHGTCAGGRSCSAGGLTACDARIPAPEACGGGDDDCDGATDEETCDDGDRCTIDACDPATGACTHAAVPCDDGNGCTVDACDPATGTCTHAAVPCDDGDRCTLDTCFPASGLCGHAPVPCDDHDACTADACDPATGACGHAAVDCRDADPCTDDGCDPASGCGHLPGTGAGCDDGDACTTGDACLAGACTGTRTPGCCTVDADCDDGLPCTVDACAPDRTCTHGLAPSWCRIDGACFGEGQFDPSDGCRQCVTAVSTAAWSASAGPTACHDGNARAGDGCSAACRVEPGWTCQGAPSVCVGRPCPGLAVRYRGSAGLGTTAVDQKGTSFTVAGLSGITFLGGTDYVAVMDNSNRLVRLRVLLKADGSIDQAAITGGLTLASSHDFEGIAWTSAARNSVFLSEEDTPAIREYSLADGAALQTLPMPAVFASRVANFGLESLTRRPEGTALWTANEEALTVDGALSTTSAGTVVRLLRLDLDGNVATPARQYAYRTEKIHGLSTTGARSGVSDLVALPGGRLLALERSFALALPPFQNRLYEVDLTAATDVSGLAGLAGTSWTAAGKRNLWTQGVNNLEGLCQGPQLAGGNGSLVGVIDDGDPLSTNAVVSFELVVPASCLE